MSVLRQACCCLPREVPKNLCRLHQSFRTFRLKAPGKRSHYDSLGISPGATQEDIKKAYYKLSMLYHPDKNKGSEEAANHFKTITEAYEILGNYKKRRLYDKGVLSEDGLSSEGQAAHEEVDPQTKFYRSRRSTPTGKTPIYDFDEWTREHYGSAFQRRAAAKNKHEIKQNMRSTMRHDIGQEYVIVAALTLVVLITYFSLKADAASLDKVAKKNKPS